MEQSNNNSFRYVCLEGHANSFALNKDNSCIAVAGRSLLKLFSIENDNFIETYNMRKQPNLSFCSNAIAWSHIETNILATAATNGCIGIWDLNKLGRQKQHSVYHDHERTTNAVIFHKTDPSFLLSASQDSTIKLFDLREKTKSCVSTFFSTESVRDVKFNPFNCNIFASGSENGCVQLWDLRKNDKFLQQFTAHSGPIYCIDWHPTQQWLATGSRDKLIKIWNMSNSKPALENTIYTIAVVGRVCWRPDRKFHIASCALVVDYSIYLWDIRRPFIPYASFNKHSNVTTDIAFKGVPDILISTSKDSTILKHNTKNAERIAQTSNPQSTSINFRGEILFVSKSKAKIKQTPPIVSSSSSLKLGQILPLAKKIMPVDCVDSASPGIVSEADLFHLAKSSLHFFPDTLPETPNAGSLTKSDDIALTKTLHKDFQFFTKCAQEYRLKSNSVAEFLEALDHNSQIARKYGRPSISILWCLVKNVYNLHKSVHYPQRQSSNQSNNIVNTIAISNLPENENVSINEEIIALNESNEIIGSNWTAPKIAVSDFEVEVYDENLSQNLVDSKNLRNGFLFTGPHNYLIKEFPNCSSSVINHELMYHHYQSDQQQSQDLADSQQPENKIHSFISTPGQEVISQHWKPFQILADSLTLQSEIGDVQTPTCILLCLNSFSLDGGRNLREELPISELMQENLLQAYIDILQRHQLWINAAEIINLSAKWMPIIAEINEQSTMFHTACGECGRVVQKNSYCKFCKSCEPSRCAICLEIVRGAYAFCNVCCHGGHIDHVVNWFQQNPKCPKCNHLCEYD